LNIITKEYLGKLLQWKPGDGVDLTSQL